jgi:hypothetical protein
MMQRRGFFLSLVKGLIGVKVAPSMLDSLPKADPVAERLINGARVGVTSSVSSGVGVVARRMNTVVCGSMAFSGVFSSMALSYRDESDLRLDGVQWGDEDDED